MRRNYQVVPLVTIKRIESKVSVRCEEGRAPFVGLLFAAV